MKQIFGFLGAFRSEMRIPSSSSRHRRIEQAPPTTRTPHVVKHSPPAPQPDPPAPIADTVTVTGKNPFDDLPIELIERIFMWIHKIHFAGGYLCHNYVWCLRQVCRRWLAIVTTSPRLYKTMSLEVRNTCPVSPWTAVQRVREMAGYLSFSRSLPLTIFIEIACLPDLDSREFYGWYPGSIQEKELFYSHLQLLLGESHRWEALHLIVHTHPTLNGFLSKWNMPINKLVKLDLKLPGVPKVSWELTNSNAPLLESISIEYPPSEPQRRAIILPWNQLKHLCLAIESTYYSNYTNHGLSLASNDNNARINRYSLGRFFNNQTSFVLRLPNLVSLDLKGAPIGFPQRHIDTPLLESLAFMVWSPTCLKHFSQLASTCHHLTSIEVRWNYVANWPAWKHYDMLFSSVPKLRHLTLTASEVPEPEWRFHIRTGCITEYLIVEPGQPVLCPDLETFTLKRFAIRPYSLCKMIRSRSGYNPSVSKLQGVRMDEVLPFTRFPFHRQQELRVHNPEVQDLLLHSIIYMKACEIPVHVGFFSSVLELEETTAEERRFPNKTLRMILGLERKKFPVDRWLRKHTPDNEDALESGMYLFSKLTGGV